MPILDVKSVAYPIEPNAMKRKDIQFTFGAMYNDLPLHPVCIHDDPIARSISAEKLHLATAVTTVAKSKKD